MSFLDKLRVKKSSSIMPPPPPADRKPVQVAEPATPTSGMPIPPPADVKPLQSPTPPAADPMPSAPKPIAPPPPLTPPSQSTPPPMPSMQPASPKPSAPGPMPTEPSGLPMQTPPQSDDVPFTQQKPHALTKPSREEMVNKLSDMPPVSGSSMPPPQSNSVEHMDVDKLVLPTSQSTSEQEEEEITLAPPVAPEPVATPQLAPQPAMQQPEPQGFTGPFYVDVKTYEQVQKSVGDLAKRLEQLEAELEEATKVRQSEDKDFAKVVKMIEKVQDDLLSIDRRLFEDQ